MAIALALEKERGDRTNDLPPGHRALFQAEALTGYEMLTWGYDERSVGCVIMAQPTMSKALSRQSVGRGLRLGYRAVAR
jgi:superfamily II DNA or RNA helicase